MATTEHFRNGGGTTFSFVFPILANSDLNVEIYNATTKLWDAKTENTSGQTDNDYTISNTNVVFNSATPTGTGNVHIYRKTNVDNPAVVYAAGSSIRAVDLNDNQTQVLYSTQETSNQLVRESDLKDSIISTDKLVDLNVTTAKLANNAVTTAKIADNAVTTVKVLDDAITNAKIADDAVDTAQIANGAVDTQQLAANSVNADKIADDVINSEHYVAGSIDLEHMSANSVDSDQYVDGSIDRVHLEADIIDSTKLADNAVNSEHYVDGSIDTEHIANYAISHDKLALNSVRSQNIVDGTVATSDIANSAVTTNKIANNAVDTTELANGAVTADKIGANAVTNAKIADDAVDTQEIANSAIITAKINDAAVNQDKIAPNSIATDKIQNAAVTISKINNAAIVTNSEQASHSVNDITFFTTAAAEARYFNASTGETIKDGQSFPDNDTTIATTAAINDRIIDLVDDVGGFRPIPNQNSFPSTNPDVNGNAGTIVSVKEATTALTAQSGTTLTLPNGRGTGNAVIITGVSATIPQGFGFLVETTSTDHTYTFHRLVPKATEVTTVAGKATEIGRLGTAAAVADMAILGTADVVADMAILGTNDVVADLNTLGTADVVADLNTLGTADVVSDMNALATTNNITSMSTCKDNIASINNCSTNISSVNNYGDQYQVASNNPSTDGGGNALAAGDLYFNTSANELKVYNGSAWQAGVTATGNFALTTGNTFTGDNRYNDGVKALYGTGSDLEIYHTNNHSYIDNSTGSLFLRGDTIKLRPKSVDEDCIESFANGAVRLYYDNAEKFATVSIGANVTGRLRVTDYVDIANGADLFLTDNGKAVFGNGSDLQIYHDGGGSKIVHANVGDLQINNTSADTWIASDGVVRISNTSHNGYMAKFDEDGAVELYHNNVKKFETSSTGGILSGTKWTFLDNTKGTFGTGDDLQIYHSGSHSFIDHTNGTGHLIINSSASNNVDIMRAGHGEYMARFKPDNASELYYDNSKKFETTSSGNKATGKLGIDDGDGSSGNYLSFGNSDDMKIFHSGSHSMIKHFGTGNFFISCDNEAEIVLRPKLNESGIVVKPNGSAELFYDHGKKFETTSGGSQATGLLRANNLMIDGSSGYLSVPDGRKAYFGTGDDLQIYHDGSNSFLNNGTGDLYLDGSSSGSIHFTQGGTAEVMASMNANGSVSLRHNNSIKFETKSYGVKVEGDLWLDDSNTIKVGSSGDLQIYHDGSNSVIKNTTGSLYLNAASSEVGVKIVPNAETELRYDNSTKFQTLSNGVRVTGQVDVNGGSISLEDDRSIFFGVSDDLQIVHDGANSNIINSTGSLFVRGNTIKLRDAAGNEDYVEAFQNGAVRLYYDNSLKLYTDNAGVVVKGNLYLTDADNREIHMGANQDFRILHDGTYNKIYGSGNHNMYFYTNGTLRTVIQTDGHLRPASNDTYDLGTSVDRWRNIYTADLQLSNKGKSNDVDGTWGDYTMQEGENDLFLINNRSGRKYKFNLTEVS